MLYYYSVLCTYLGTYLGSRCEMQQYKQHKEGMHSTCLFHTSLPRYLGRYLGPKEPPSEIPLETQASPGSAVAVETTASTRQSQLPFWAAGTVSTQQVHQPAGPLWPLPLSRPCGRPLSASRLVRSFGHRTPVGLLSYLGCLAQYQNAFKSPSAEHAISFLCPPSLLQVTISCLVRAFPSTNSLPSQQPHARLLPAQNSLHLPAPPLFSPGCTRR